MRKMLFIILIFLTFIITGCSKTQEDDCLYTIKRIEENINWDNIDIISIDKILWTDDFGIRAFGQLCHDEENLYVHLRAIEENIRAEYTEPLSSVYQDSCLEFFFKLVEENNYFNFEINPNGCLCLQFGPLKTDRISITRSDDKSYFAINTKRTNDGWEVFYKIPLDFIKLFYQDYEFKGELLINLYKCGDKTVNKHYLSWMSIDLDKPNFHCPEYFGKVRFE